MLPAGIVAYFPVLFIGDEVHLDYCESVVSFTLTFGRQIIQIAQAANPILSDRPYCPALRRNSCSLRKILPSSKHATSPRAYLLRHGVFSILPHYYQDFPGRLVARQRRVWSFTVRLDCTDISLLCDYIRSKCYVFLFRRSETFISADIHDHELVTINGVVETWLLRYLGPFDQIFHVGMAIGLTVHFLAFARALDQFYIAK